MVGEVRGVGLLATLEFVADKETKAPFDAALKVGPKVSAAALDEGMIARAMPLGDILGFAPPLVITRAEVDRVVEMTRRAVDRVHRSLRGRRGLRPGGARRAARRRPPRDGERGLELCLLSSPENIFYLTGLDHWGYFAPHLLLVPAEGELVLVARAMERVTVANQVANARFVGHSDDETVADKMLGVIAEASPPAARIGLESWSAGLPHGLAEALRQGLPNARLGRRLRAGRRPADGEEPGRAGLHARGRPRLRCHGGSRDRGHRRRRERAPRRGRAPMLP